MSDMAYRPKINNIIIKPYDAKDANTFIVADEEYAHYVLIKKPGVMLFEAMNGERTPEELQTYLMQTHHIKLTMEQINHFLDMGMRNNFLMKESWHHHDTKAGPNRLWNSLRRKYILIRTEQLSHWLHKHRLIWLNPVTLSLILAGLVLALTFFFFPSRFPTLDGSALRYDASLFLQIIPLFIFQVALHEFGHLLACGYFGVSSQGFGVGLLWRFVPMFFTDTSRAYMLSNRWQRVIISAAGPFMDMMMLGFYAGLLFLLPRDHHLVYLLRNYMPFLMSIIILNLNPFLVRFDGYWILVDALNKPNLYRNAMRYIRIKLLSFIGRAPKKDALIVQAQLKQNPYMATMYVGYFFFATVASAVFLFLLFSMFFQSNTF